MLRHRFTTIAAALLSGGLLIPALCADDSNHTTGTMAVQPEGLSPFTHVARIPAGADLRTIRFEGVKMVELPTAGSYTMDADYCHELTFRDPGGSIACLHVQPGAPVAAYEATYSFIGQPLASDEYANQYFTFAVYFRPDELPADAQKALASHKMSREDAAGYFTVSTGRELVSRVAIDNSQSHFCEGNYVDGAWTRSNQRCQDKIAYGTLTEPSGYVTVKVDPTGLLAGR